MDSLFLIENTSKKSLIYTGKISKNTVAFLNNKIPFFNSYDDKRDKFHLFLGENNAEYCMKEDSIGLIQNSYINSDTILVVNQYDQENITQEELKTKGYTFFLYDIKNKKKLLSIGIRDNYLYRNTLTNEYKEENNLIFFSYTKWSGSKKRNYTYFRVADLKQNKILIVDSIVTCDVISKSCNTYPLRSVQFADSLSLIYSYITVRDKELWISINEYNLKSQKRKTSRIIKLTYFEYAFVYHYRFGKDDYFLTENELFKIDIKNRKELIYSSNNLIFKDFIIQ